MTDKGYHHTQTGILIPVVSIIAILVAGFVSIVMSQMSTDSIILFGIVVIILFAALAMFTTLSVSVNEGFLRIRFGPVGLIKKAFPLKEIVSCSVVRNPWYYGFGIRYTPHGTLYNVSGYDAVEILKTDGTTFRIGTNEPHLLAKAIQEGIRAGGNTINPAGN